MKYQMKYLTDYCRGDRLRTGSCKTRYLASQTKSEHNIHVDHLNPLNQDDDWVTINGTHVLIDENGTAMSGGNLVGKSFTSVKSKSSHRSAETLPPKVEKAHNNLVQLSKTRKIGDSAVAQYKKTLNSLPSGYTVHLVSKHGDQSISLQKKQNGLWGDDDGFYDYDTIAELFAYAKPESITIRSSTSHVEKKKENVLKPGNETTSNGSTYKQKENTPKKSTDPQSKNEPQPPEVVPQAKQFTSFSDASNAIKKMSDVELYEHLRTSNPIRYNLTDKKDIKAYLSKWSSIYNKDSLTKSALSYAAQIEEDKFAREQFKKVPKSRGHIDSSKLPEPLYKSDGGHTKSESLARIADLERSQAIQIMADTGVSRGEAISMQGAIADYSDHLYPDIRKSQVEGTPNSQAKLIEKYINLAPKWNGGKLYRGVSLSKESAEHLLERIQRGETIDQRGTSSWSSSRGVAKEFANRESKGKTKFIFISSGTKKGCSIKHLSSAQSDGAEENEVLVSEKARWKPVGITHSGGYWIIDCEEL